MDIVFDEGIDMGMGHALTDEWPWGLGFGFSCS